MKIEVVKERTKEQPFYSEIKKYEIVAPWQGMPDVTYDPFPDAQMEDVVRREIICRELLWFATLKGDDIAQVNPSIMFVRGDKKFTVTSAEIRFDEGTCEVEGSMFLSKCEPRELIKRLRGIYAESNPGTK
jgi:hypothetical protein